jgi:hypothetical protein
VAQPSASFSDTIPQQRNRATNMTDEKAPSPHKKKPGRFQYLVLKVLVLIVLALLIGMCSFRYIS